MSCQSAGGEFLGRQAPGDAGIVDEDVEPAEGGMGFGDDGGDRRLVGDIEGEGRRLAACRRDFIGDGFRRAAVDVGDRDAGARRGERGRRDPADAGAGAGDQRCVAVDAKEIEDIEGVGHDFHQNSGSGVSAPRVGCRAA